MITPLQKSMLMRKGGVLLGDFQKSTDGLFQRMPEGWELRKGLVFEYATDSVAKKQDDTDLSAEQHLIIVMLKRNGWCDRAAADFVRLWAADRLPTNSDEMLHILEAQARVVAAEKVKSTLDWSKLYNKPETLTETEVNALPTLSLSGVLRRYMENANADNIKLFKKYYPIYQARQDRCLPDSVKNYQSNGIRATSVGY